jgi:hypothetical protein
MRRQAGFGHVPSGKSCRRCADVVRQLDVQLQQIVNARPPA